MTKDCIYELKRNVSLFTEQQRQRLAVSKDDYISSFIYQIGIMFDDNQEPGSFLRLMSVFFRNITWFSDENNPQVRHVEVTYVAHLMPNYKELVNKFDSFGQLNEEVKKRGGPIVVNYRFIRNYTKGVEDSWTLNALNHFYLYEAAERQ